MLRLSARGLCSAPAFPPLIFSGIQPTGVAHLGNYFGAIQRWVELQSESRAPMMVMVADLHALTTRVRRESWEASLGAQVREMAASLLACGLDPARVVLFRQSAVVEHLQLAWLLNSAISLQKLQRLSQFKAKAAAAGGTESTPAGLLIYPVLMAADILLYKATAVPVGEDQRQHFQVVRDVAFRANGLLRPEGPPLFPTPEALASAVPRLKSLRSATDKMSKSDPDERSRILISDPPYVVNAKLRKALTDSIGKVEFDPEKRPAVSNLVTLHAAVSKQSPVEIVAAAAGLQTAEYKSVVAGAVNSFLEPIRGRFSELMGDPDSVDAVLDKGNDAARIRAAETMTEISKTLDRK